MKVQEKTLKGGYLVHFEWNDHFKSGDNNFKGLFAIKIFHRIGAIHFAHFGTEVTTTNILIFFARVYLWLHTNHPFAFNLSKCSRGIINVPVPTK